MTQTVSIFGSTGSVGISALDVIENANKNNATSAVFEIDTLVAGQQVELLASQAKRFHAKHAVIADENGLELLRDALKNTCIEIAAGHQAVIDAASRKVDKTIAAIVGIQGLPSIMAAIERGGDIILANKESLVCGGMHLLSKARKSGAMILPADSEHSAIMQCLSDKAKPIRLTITGSGGPFWQMPLAELAIVTPEQALAHPVWKMGPKISLDSASMMNKALELIEAAYLFGFPECEIDVLIHPQSVLHGMVSYCDGSVIAQLGSPDMRTPLACALAWPNRISTDVKALNLAKLAKLTFSEPDHSRFGAINLAREAVRYGAGMPLVLNASNEAAGAIFLNRKCGFLDITEATVRTIDAYIDGKLDTDISSPSTLSEIIALDEITRQATKTILAELI